MRGCSSLSHRCFLEQSGFAPPRLSPSGSLTKAAGAEMVMSVVSRDIESRVLKNHFTEFLAKLNLPRMCSNLPITPLLMLRIAKWAVLFLREYEINLAVRLLKSDSCCNFKDEFNSGIVAY